MGAFREIFALALLADVISQGQNAARQEGQGQGEENGIFHRKVRMNLEGLESGAAGRSGSAGMEASAGETSKSL